MCPRITVTLVVAAVLAVGPAAPAAASTVDEVRAGRAVLAALGSQKTSCAALTAGQLGHVGELAAQRAVGSIAAHDALDARMTAVMGGGAERRMHVLMGRRYAGCAATAGTVTDAAGSMMGGGGTGTGTDVDGAMMGDGTGTPLPSGSGLPDHAAMMRSADWRWMRDDAWRSMSDVAWTSLQARWMGPRMMTPTGDASSGLPRVGVAVLLVLVVALGGALLTRLVPRRPIDPGPR